MVIDYQICIKIDESMKDEPRLCRAPRSERV